MIAFLLSQIGKLKEGLTTTNSNIATKLGDSNLSATVLADLNNGHPATNSIMFFVYSNTATNKPASGGGTGISFGNVTYGVQLAFYNRGADENILYYRNWWSSGAEWGAWRQFAVV